MKTLFLRLSTLFCLLLLSVTSCKKDPDPVPKSVEKSITAFSFGSLTPAVVATVDASAKTITATLPAGSDVTKLVPTIAVSAKATVSPTSGVAQDFSKLVTYTVTAEDGSTQAYLATITVEKPVNNGTVYVGNLDGYLYAVDAQTGDKKWEFKTGGAVQATPTVANGLVYIASWDKKLYALDATTGVKKWEFAGAGIIQPYGAVMVADGLVYVNGSNLLYALDATTGAKKWEFLGDDTYPFEASPTVVNGVVYASLRGTAASKQGVGTFALDAKTGAKLWSKPTGVWVTESAPAVVNNLLYAGSEGTGFSAFDATSGSEKWRFTLASVATSAPTVANGFVYIGSGTFGKDNKKLYALDATTGIKKWEYATEESTAGYSSPIVANGIVYIGSGSTLYAVDAASGAKKWEAKPEANTLIYSGPVVASGLVYIGIGKKLYAFIASTGSKKWEYDTGRTIDQSSPCVVDKDGTVYHAGISGMVQ